MADPPQPLRRATVPVRPPGAAVRRADRLIVLVSFHHMHTYLHHSCVSRCQMQTGRPCVALRLASPLRTPTPAQHARA